MSERDDHTEYNGPERRQYSHIERQLQAIIDRMDNMCGAFPLDEEGKVDFTGHRKAHDAMIKAARAEEDFWREMKLDLAKKGAWGLFLILCGLVFVGISVKLGFGAGK